MKRTLVFGCLTLVWSLGLAQDLVITNARLLDGTGMNIPNGSVVIRGGRIVSSGAGTANAPGVPVLDAGGMTVMPGFIDAHRHIISGDADTWFREESIDRMREFLEAGYTTLMSGGGPDPGIFELERRINSGELAGPRIITSVRDDPRTYKTPEAARQRVRDIAAMRTKFIKVRIDSAEDAKILAEITDEAKQYDLDVMVHASTVPMMLAAVDAGATKLVHSPNDSYMTPADAKRVADAGIENLSTVGFAVPLFGVFNQDNVPTFRDGSKWPEEILGTGMNAAGEKVINGRILWDAGVVYGFGTDTGYLPWEGLKHELRTLNLMFSPIDMVKMMGPNTAAFFNMEDELGTLQPGMIADIVLIDGDPLYLIFELLKVKVVIQSGRITVDKR
jgi:imidazolonepropionase-like amidohydrolase